jgi:hypothetical protein
MQNAVLRTRTRVGDREAGKVERDDANVRAEQKVWTHRL